MASWITIYLQESLENLDIETIKKGVAPADWWTLGEEFGVKEEEVNRFMKSLQWRDNPLEIGQEGIRPIQIHIWNSPDRIKEEIAELSHTPSSVSQHLEKVKTIVALEFGISQLKTMHEVIAFEIAYWLSETKHGVIRAPDNSWYDYDQHRWKAILE